MTQRSYEELYTSPAEWLAYLGRRYQETRNPLAAWFAIRCCMETGAPLPDFARDYLLFVSTDLCRLSELDERRSDVAATRETLRGTRDTRMAAVLDTLRLRPEGRGRKADAFQEWAGARAECLVELVRLCRNAGGMTRAEAIELTARTWGTSLSTVKRALEKRD